jgi:hypothetical protein
MSLGTYDLSAGSSEQKDVAIGDVDVSVLLESVVLALQSTNEELLSDGHSTTGLLCNDSESRRGSCDGSVPPLFLSGSFRSQIEDAQTMEHRLVHRREDTEHCSEPQRIRSEQGVQHERRGDSSVYPTS